MNFNYCDGKDRQRVLEIHRVVRIYPRVHVGEPPFDCYIDNCTVDSEGNDVLLYTKKGQKHEIYLEDIDTLEVY